MTDRLRHYSLALRAAIYVLPLLSFLIAGLVAFHGMKARADLSPVAYLSLALLTTMVWSVVAEQQHVTSVEKISAENTGLRAPVAACTVTYLLDMAVLFFSGCPGYSRLLFALSAVILLVLTLSVRTLFRVVLRGLADHRPALRVAIVGVGRFAARAAAQVGHNEFVRCEVVGYIRLSDEEIHVDDAPVVPLGDIEAIERLNVDNILVAIPPDHYSLVRRCIAKLEPLCKPIRVIVDVGEGLLVRDRVRQVGRLQMLDLDPGPSASLGYFLGKRAVDVLLSTAVLAILALPMLAIALAIRLSSPGPVFFRQQRVGRNGNLFTMYKFRTMRLAPESEGDTRWTTSADPRRTGIGAFLRRFSLDELPQFFNVLRGEMSVVGPRPERPHFVRRFRKDIALYQTRHHLNVGITGWAQVNGLRGDTSIRRRVQYDLYYLQHWSMLFDLRIIWMTLWVGFTDKNAY
jgi:exopolysaccharide biosynthesis polyprenyl glycosylphosphotransferase